MRAILWFGLLIVCALSPAQQTASFKVRVVDEKNTPIAGATVGISVWDARRGQFYFATEPFFQTADAQGTVIPSWNSRVERPVSEILSGERGGYAVLWVWASGYVAKHVFVRYPATEQEQTIQLRKGRPVELHLTRSDGASLPADFGSALRLLPEDNIKRNPRSYADLAVLPFQGADLRDEERRPAGMELRVRFAPQLLCLGFGMERIQEGKYRVVLPPESRTALLAIDRRGLLRGYLSSLSESEISAGIAERVLPKPGTLTARYDLSRAGNRHANFRVSLIRVMADDAFLFVEEFVPESPTGVLNLSDVAPGERWHLMVEGADRDNYCNDASMPTTVVEGGQAYLAFTYQPFNLLRYQGDRTLTLRFLTVEGRPLANRPYKLYLYVPPYSKFLLVGQGRLDAQGQVRLTQLYENPPYRRGFPAQPTRYIVELDVGAEDSLNYPFTLYLGDGVSERTFYRSLQVGDSVSNVSLTELATGNQRRLSEFRGKWVLIHFWATWCKPCIASFEQLEQTMQVLARHNEVRHQLEVLKVSIDSRPETAIEFLKNRNWLDTAQHFWVEGGESALALLFGVSGIPHYVIIDPEGRVAWNNRDTLEPVEQALSRLMGIEL